MGWLRNASRCVSLGLGLGEVVENEALDFLTKGWCFQPAQAACDGVLVEYTDGHMCGIGCRLDPLYCIFSEGETSHMRNGESKWTSFF